MICRSLIVTHVAHCTHCANARTALSYPRTEGHAMCSLCARYATCLDGLQSIQGSPLHTACGVGLIQANSQFQPPKAQALIQAACHCHNCSVCVTKILHQSNVLARNPVSWHVCRRSAVTFCLVTTTTCGPHKRRNPKCTATTPTALQESSRPSGHHSGTISAATRSTALRTGLVDRQRCQCHNMIQ